MVDKQGMTLSFTQYELQNTKYLLNKIEAENDAVKQRLVASETKVEALERVNLAQEAEVTAVKTRLVASETELLNLRKEAAAQTADLRSVAERLVATETDMEHMKKDTAAQHTDLTNMKTEVMNLIKEQAAQEAELIVLKTRINTGEAQTRLAATETEVVNLEKEITEKPKVAFSAGLTDSGYIEAGNTELNLVFTRIITNVGQAYSNMTGFFTAPVKGVYYFRFTVMDVLNSRLMYIRMFKNEEQVMWLGQYDNDGQRSYFSSGVTLQLEVGDVVNMRLPAGHRLYDNSDNHSTFSGFLVFPL
ncbi:uncharacterized protein LOC116222813 [Clupea harengus]|uniref:Uncharacterized protein LOC116222813 n=1 Tax=Clupea harengus TaxID=7950 RepID=A0A8M1KUE9_CLUHA|nr:uncharacterized protein LOC116222813 [Clupea harengus]